MPVGPQRKPASKVTYTNRRGGGFSMGIGNFAPSLTVKGDDEGNVAGYNVGRAVGQARRGSPERTTTRGTGDDTVTTTTYQHRKYRGDKAIINAGDKPASTFLGDIPRGRGVNVPEIRRAGPGGKVRRR